MDGVFDRIPAAAGTRLLLVDDNPKLWRMVKEYLEPLGYEVSLAHTGPDGLEKALNGDFHAVILDVMLPGLDGFAVLRQLRAQSAIPVLMLTGRGEAPDRIAGLELGADDYVPKTFSPRELLARLRAVIRRPMVTAAQPSNAFFLSGRGRPLSYTMARRTFAQIARAAGIKKTDGQRGPCLHSFRHGFAVGRLLAWCRAGLEVSSWWPHLSVYLGHLNKEETYWYLTATPELLTAAGDAFCRYGDDGEPK